MTNHEYAVAYWTAEGWGEPRDEEQARLWTLFFTRGEPEKRYRARTWVRPDLWVEELIRA